MLVTVMVDKDIQIASSITLSVIPLTVDEAIASGGPVPSDVPVDNPYSPNRAGRS